MSEPLLPDTTSDERDVGWGDDRDSDRYDEDGHAAADERRLREDRPPHHDRA